MKELPQLPLPGNDGMRASSQDRDETVAILCEAYAAGRLDLTEIRDRTGVACGARTRGELRRLIADLPASLGSPAAFPTATGLRSGVKLSPQRGRATVFAMLTILASVAMVTALFMMMAAFTLAALTLLIVSVSVLVAVGMVDVIPVPGEAKPQASYRS